VGVLECTRVFKAPIAQHLNDSASARARADVALHSIIAFLGSSAGVLDRGLLGLERRCARS
jgi:hypothetical protein